MTNKQTLVVFLIIIVIAAGFLYWKFFATEKAQEGLADIQARELELLREQSAYQTLSDSDMEKQTTEVDDLKKKSDYKKVTDEEVQTQMNELDKLRAAAQ